MASRPLITISLEASLRRELKRAAGAEGKSVSRYIRDVLRERLEPTPHARRKKCPMTAVSGIANGELTGFDIDDELYG